MKALAPLALAALSVPAPAQQRLADLHQMVPYYPDEPQVAMADLDGDGIPEIVHGSDRLRLLRSAGDGRFVEDEGAFPMTNSVGLVVIADLTCDGHLDVAAITAGSPSSFLFAGDGEGGLTEVPGAIPVSVGAFLSDGIAVGDLDGDADLDLVGARDAQIFWNDGTGHFTAGPEVAGCCDSENDVALVDVDLDDDLDIVLASGGGSSSVSRVWENLSPGVFAEIAGALPDDNWNYVESGDFDEDGDPDLVFLGVRGALVLNDGSGVFTEQPGAFPEEEEGGNAVLVVDVDGDSHLDIVFADPSTAFGPFSGNAIAVLLGDGTGAFESNSGLSPPKDNEGQTRFLLADDVDGDTDLDLILALWRGSDRVLLRDGSNEWINSQVRIPFEAAEPPEVAAADFDGDGLQDVLVGHREDLLWLGDGAGGFRESPAGLPSLGTSLPTEHYAVGDVDEDGDVDVLAVRGEVQLLLNQGDGAFVLAPANLPLDTDAFDLDLADLDADGDLDVVVGHVAAGARVWLNDGAGVFSAVAGAFPAGAAFLSAAVADLNDDGLPEVFGTGTFPDRLYRNLGGGTFSDASAMLPPGGEDGHDAEFFDADGDGDLDLFVTRLVPSFPAPVPAQDQLYLYEHGVGFTDATARLPQELTLGSEILAADLDEDGDVDLLVANGYAFGLPPEEIRFLENDGAGVFTKPADAIPYATPVGLAAADFDGDEDLDVFGGRWIWSNVRHQLAWRALPRIGKEIAFDLWGDPGKPWLLVCSTGRFQATLLAGTLWVDPSQIVLTRSGVLDGNGRGETIFAVPPDPVLLGIPFYWQALFRNPSRFSNLEVAILTAG